MNYAEQLRYIQTLDNETALETIKSVAAEASTTETLVKLFTGALVSETDTRYGEDSVGIIANAIGITKPTAYQRAQLVTFYNGYYHCEDLINYLPAIRYTHMRDAMRLGQYHHDTHGENAYEIALEALELAADENMSTTAFNEYVKVQITGEPETESQTWNANQIEDDDDLGEIYSRMRVALRSKTLVSVSIKELKAAPVSPVVEQGAAD